ncbi:MAG: C40 family peptidase [Chloroherpetonaceae bacterium]
MAQRSNSQQKSLIYLLIFFLLMAGTFEQSYAKKSSKKKYSRRTTSKTTSKKISIDIMRQSDDLSEMANLTPYTIDSTDMVSVDANNQIIGEEGEDLEEVEREDTFQYDAESFQMLWLSLVDEDNTAAGVSKSEMLSRIMDLFGTPYRFGGVSTRGIDCSAFTRLIYQDVANIELPRTAREQYNYGVSIKKMSDLQFGDLIFFHTYSRRFPSHVGIYLGDGLFAHSGIRYGVAVASLNSPYYTKRFIGGKRLSDKDMQVLKSTDEKDSDLKASM